ncbi:MAG TPA: S1C family serine protease [Beijerinckiaceae bacterium]|jgi:S1-C subfamily serine protease
MAGLSDWKVPPGAQPKPQDYPYDLDRALSAVVSVTATIPPDAFTAQTLGTERAGHGVQIQDGVVLTIGYLVTEAQSVWLMTGDGRAVQGHVLGYDQVTGFGLVQALGRLDLPSLELGDSAAAGLGERVVVAGAGGRSRAVAARIVARQEFAGYWEYVLDEAIFTAPAHPHWGGTAVIGPAGDLLGIGSLQLQHMGPGGRPALLNMVVPIDLLKPILQDLLTLGRPNRPPRPWLGLFAAEAEDKVVVAGLAEGGPADRAGLRAGDAILAVRGAKVGNLAGFFRRVWALGHAGVDVPLAIGREGRTVEITVPSGDRNRFLKGPLLH